MDRRGMALRAIQQSMASRGYPPTVREVCEAIGVESPSTGHRLLERMVSQGLITLEPLSPRTMRITAAGMKAMTEEL